MSISWEELVDRIRPPLARAGLVAKEGPPLEASPFYDPGTPIFRMAPTGEGGRVVVAFLALLVYGEDQGTVKGFLTELPERFPLAFAPFRPRLMRVAKPGRPTQGFVWLTLNLPGEELTAEFLSFTLGEVGRWSEEVKDALPLYTARLEVSNPFLPLAGWNRNEGGWGP